ncbi:hypothetical protein C3418_14985 [Aeromonas sp. ASNIH8]|nr:hypothetical protein C3418_14985 [Aeromonas sp. ASNIH8]
MRTCLYHGCILCDCGKIEIDGSKRESVMRNVVNILLLHIPVENEHLFRFKMNADSGLRVHHFRTPQSTNSDVR